MASAPQTQLPLFYNALEPLSSQAHANYKIRAVDRAPFLAKHHAVPVTVDEFTIVQRFMPIVFTLGDEGVPIALMGMNEGINVFIDDEGALIDSNFYVPAYIRRYPYLLAKLRPDAQDLSLCFDPTSDTIGAFDEGMPVFENGEPTQIVKDVLTFTEQFEVAGARTQAFMNELKELDLLIDGEVTIQQDNGAQPYVYRGFRMVSEEKLRELRGDQLRKMAQSGLLPLIYAHLFSLSLVRDIFNRQVMLGKMPPPPVAIANPAAPANA